jgi:diaminopimelate decarboxylase
MHNDVLLSLAQQFGTPLFVLNEAALTTRVQAFCQAFHTVWHNTRVCYSVKTNYLPWILRKMAILGVTPEVISGFELDLINRLDIEGTIIVNGPVKTADELTLCLKKGYCINVDNLDELKLIIELATTLRCIAKVGLRIRPANESWKRFGFEFSSPSWRQALALFALHPCLQLMGLHTHIGTGIIDLARYQAAAEYIRQVARSLPQPLTYIDMGGGFATARARLSHYSADDWQVPSDNDYAKALFAPLSDYLQHHNCQLIVEPGRALIDDAISLLTSVVSVEDGRLIVDAGKNILPSVESRIHPILPVYPPRSDIAAFDIFGPLCMGSDCLGRQIELPRPRVSDLLQVASVGAYSQSQSMHFIKYQAPVVVIESTGQPKLVKRRQTLSDLLQTDVL